MLYFEDYNSNVVLSGVYDRAQRAVEYIMTHQLTAVPLHFQTSAVLILKIFSTLC